MQFLNLRVVLRFSGVALILAVTLVSPAPAADVQPGVTPRMRVAPAVNAQPVSQAWHQEYAAAEKTLEEADGIVRRLDMHQRKLKQLAMRLHSAGGDEQMAKLELQDLLQKQQQVLQMMSRISREMDETEKGIVSKMGD